MSRSLPSPTTEGRVGRLRYHAAPSRDEMGRLAANQAAEILRTAVAQRGSARAVFAAAPSQDELLLALREAEVPWEAVTTFHLDEYLGLHENAPQLFRRYLEEHLFCHLPFREVHLILTAGERLEPKEASNRYEQLLGDVPLDLACIGIGENGHIAFNDPLVADFNDPHRVRVVKLEETCRRQQVHGSTFARLEEVPLQAVTLTVPTIMAARAIVCVVPGERKREALRRALYGPVTSDCPASVLRTHPNIMLYLDPESTAALREPG